MPSQVLAHLCEKGRPGDLALPRYRFLDEAEDLPDVALRPVPRTVTHRPPHSIPLEPVAFHKSSA